MKFCHLKNNPANAPAITGAALQEVASAFMTNNPQSRIDNAFEKLKRAGYGLDFANALYWMGVLAECELVSGEDASDAKIYYESAADEGHSNAKARLRQLNNGASTYDPDDVLTTLRQMSIAVNSATIPSMPSLQSSSSNSSGRSSSSCSKCGGRGYEFTAYKHSASADSYHNYAGNSCSICGGTSDHYHYRCTH